MVLVGKREGKRPFETPRHRRGLILKGSSGSVMWGALTGSSWLRIGTGGGHLSMR